MSYGIYDGIFKLKETKEVRKFSVLNESDEESEGYDWRVTFHLPNLGSEYDDDFENFDEQVTITAIDADEALKYAQQHIRVQEKDNDSWKDAEILSIERM